MTEFEFGLALGEFQSTGIIYDLEVLNSVVDTVNTMRRLLITYYWQEGDGTSLDNQDEVIWNEVKVQYGVGTENAKKIVLAIQYMYSDLEDGDLEDAFGSSGWKDMVFH